MSEVKVASKTATLFLKRLDSAGGDVAALVRKWELGPDWKEQPVRLTPAALRELTAEIATALRDPDMGVHLALEVQRGAYGAVEYLSRSASSLREGLRFFQRYSALVLDQAEYTLEDRDDEVVFEQQLAGEPLMLGPHISEMMVVFFHKRAAETAGRPVPLVRAWVAHPRRPEAKALETALGCPVRFGAGRNGFAVLRSVVDLPMATKDEALASLMARQAEAELAQKPVVRSLVDEVRHRIRRALPHGDADCDRIARALQLSSRTLQRRLAEAETSFVVLLDEERLRAAEKYLADPGLELNQVALLLGYSDQPAFTRAFKRWTGKTPSEARAAQKPAGGAPTR